MVAMLEAASFILLVMNSYAVPVSGSVKQTIRNAFGYFNLVVSTTSSIFSFRVTCLFLTG